MECDSEQLKELALFAGESKAGCYVDSTEGEYILVRGGGWGGGGDAGVFSSNLATRAPVPTATSGAVPLISRSTETPDTETLTAKR